MLPEAKNKMIPLKDAIDIFWQWRLASIRIEVQWFSGEPKSPGAVRMHVDGLVSLMDPEGVVTVSGDGREIEFDLRQCAVKHLKGKPGETGGVHPLDPDASLQIEFPNGEVCLVFPFRRAGGPVFVQQEIWQRGLIPAAGKVTLPLSDPRPTGFSASGPVSYDASSSGGLKLRAASPVTGWLGVPIVPVAMLVLFCLMTVLAMVPSSVSNLLAAMGYSKKMADPGAMVWAIQSKGSYYCSGSVLLGREPGRFLTQADALTLGYQPADGRYCGGVMQYDPLAAAVGKGKAFFSRMAALARRVVSES
jgi:hypothetical protein